MRSNKLKTSILAMPVLMAVLATGFGFTIPEKKSEAVDSSELRLYFQHVYKAEDFLMAGQPDSAYLEYIRAEKCSIRFNNDAINEGRLLYTTQNEDLKILHLSQAFLFTPDTLKPAVFVSRFTSLLSEQGVKKLNSLITGKQKIHIVDKADYAKISATLEPLWEKDQQYRRPGSEPKDNETLKKMKQNDAENFQTIINLYKNQGSFSTMKISAVAYNAFRMILLHRFADQKLQKKHQQFFEEEILKGNLDPRDYTAVIDNYRFDSTQIYGDHSMFYYGDSLFVFKLSPEGAKRINSNREKIFLQDIELTQKKLIWQWKNQDAYRFGVIWEIEPEGSALNEARKEMQAMRRMVSGFDIYTR